ncbi:MAG: hypothetical protein IPK78_18035 [Rhodospirillales bacterium]|nr:hypothetical protein [Rhodospirillales bacterium]
MSPQRRPGYAARRGAAAPVLEAPLPAPIGGAAAAVRGWFEAASCDVPPDADGTLQTAQRTAAVLARRAKADNTKARLSRRRPCLVHVVRRPRACRAVGAARGCGILRRRLRLAAAGAAAGGADAAAAPRVDRLAALAGGLPSPAATAIVAETMAGLSGTLRRQGRGPRPKLAAKIALLREILATIADDLPGLRDRALLLVGFAGALRRAELAAIRIDDLEACEHGLRLSLPVSKGDRRGKGVNSGRADATRRLSLRRPRVSAPGARGSASSTIGAPGGRGILLRSTGGTGSKPIASVPPAPPPHSVGENFISHASLPPLLALPNDP